MAVVASLITRVLAAPDDAAVAAAVKGEVEQLCQTFPLYRRASLARRSGAPSPTTARWPARFRSSNPVPASATMAAAVATILDDGGVLLAEAGTGTGKTMAYLVPAILSGHRVLVSTGTKNLQEQIFAKDVPVLREALGVPFTATCMKGRANYLCLHRLAEYRSRQEVKGRRLAPDDAIFLPIIEQLGAADPDRRPRRAGRAARGPGAVARGVGHRRDLPGQRLPALQRVLRDADAAARRRVRRRHRQPPPAVRRRRGARERLRRGDSVVPAPGRRRGAPARGRRHAVLRRRGEQPPGRRPGARRRGDGARLRSRPRRATTPPAG